MDSFDAENADNHPVVEANWAMAAMHHAETYMKLLKVRDPKDLRLTALDAELYEHFRKDFPDFDVANVNEEHLKSADAKTKWRAFCETYKTSIHDYNFGTLLRVSPKGDYTPENTVFVVRTQFYAIELARNKEGHNTPSPASS